MRFSKPLIAAALAVSMSSAPVLAQATAPQSAAPLSIAARAGAPTKDSNQYYNSYLLPALVIIAVLAAAILLTKDNNDDIDNPFSP